MILDFTDELQSSKEIILFIQQYQVLKGQELLGKKSKLVLRWLNKQVYYMKNDK